MRNICHFFFSLFWCMVHWIMGFRIYSTISSSCMLLSITSCSNSSTESPSALIPFSSKFRLGTSILSMRTTFCRRSLSLVSWLQFSQEPPFTMTFSNWSASFLVISKGSLASLFGFLLRSIAPFSPSLCMFPLLLLISFKGVCWFLWWETKDKGWCCSSIWALFKILLLWLKMGDVWPLMKWLGLDFMCWKWGRWGVCGDRQNGCCCCCCCCWCCLDIGDKWGDLFIWGDSCGMPLGDSIGCGGSMGPWGIRREGWIWSGVELGGRWPWLWLRLGGGTMVGALEELKTSGTTCCR